jgi:hypothetical protein
MTTPPNIEQLVQTVTAEVLARLKQNRPATNSPRRRICLLVPVVSKHLAALEHQLGRLSQKGFRIQTLESEDKSLAIETQDIQPQDLIVIGSLGFAFIRSLCGLEDDNLFIRLITQALLEGRQVMAISDDLQPGGFLEKQARKHLTELKSMGIQLVSLNELVPKIELLRAQDTTLSQAVGSLLTEEHVVQLSRAGEKSLVLSARTIVTPLARSKAAELNLKLVEPVHRGER